MSISTRSTRITARVAGILILGAFPVYGIGSAVATSIALAPDNLSQASHNGLFTVSTLLMVLNSALVIGIGVAMYPVLKAHSPAVALGYFGTRIFEATFLTVGALSLLMVASIGDQAAASGADPTTFESMAAVAIAGNDVAYNVAMAGLGLGSLFLCYALYQARLVPRFLAVWGFVGYAVSAAGSVLELLGVSGAGLVGVIPGGLFEIFLGVWLIAKGFNHAAATPPASLTVSPSGAAVVH